MTFETMILLVFSVYAPLCYIYFLWLYFSKRNEENSDLFNPSWPAMMSRIIASVGAYYLYWYTLSSRIINRKASKKISMNFQFLALSMFATSLILGFFSEEILGGSKLDNEYVLKISDRFVGIIFVVWAFEIRRVLAERLGKRPSGFRTFFFGCLYLQGQLRQLKEAEQDGRQEALSVQTARA